MKQNQESKENRAEYKKLSVYVHNGEIKEKKVQKQTSESQRLSTLQEMNSDLIAWITIGETVIDYPVMQYDNSFYLSHDFNKKKSKFGSLFLEQSVRIEDEDQNLVVYGHHMQDGSMFGSLQKYEEEKYCQKHKEIVWETDTGKQKYRVFCVCLADAVENKELFSGILDKQQKVDINWIRDKSRRICYAEEPELYKEDRVLILVTCEYTTANGRILVFGKRE